MLIIVKKEQIIEGLQKASSIIPSKAGAAYLRSIWLQAEGESLTIMATDVNIEFTGTYPAVVKTPGQVGVNGRAFVELLRRLPGGEIQLRLEAEILHVEQGRRVYKLPVADPVWFQPLPPFPEQDALLWSADFLQEILDKVSFCISDDDNTEALSCLCLKALENGQGKIDACGLNGHQFAMLRFTNDELATKLPAQGLLLQKKYVAELRKWLGSEEIMLNISERRFHIRTGNGNETLSIPRALFAYPDHLSFVSRLNAADVSLLDASRKDCQEALDRLHIFNNESDRCTYFNLTAGDVTLTAQGQETGSATEHLDVTYAGSLDRIAFPTKSMLDILTHFQSTSLRFTFTGAEGPCGLAGQDDPDYTVIIMPMKIAESAYYTEE